MLYGTTPNHLGLRNATIIQYKNVTTIIKYDMINLSLLAKEFFIARGIMINAKTL